jgi:hypothetical protein
MTLAMTASCPTPAATRRWLGLTVCALSLLFAVGGCGHPVGTTCAAWKHLGGASVGEPQSRGGALVIPVRFHGIRSKSDAGLYVDHVRWELDDKQIEFSLLAYVGYERTSCSGTALIRIDEPLEAGMYTVAYRDPDGAIHRVGNVTIPEQRIRTVFPWSARTSVGLAVVVMLALALGWFCLPRDAEHVPKDVRQLLGWVRDYRAGQYGLPVAAC